jgi:hypothetical protein
MVTNVPGNQPGQCPEDHGPVCRTDSRLSRQSGPAAACLFEVKGTISVDTALDRFIMILIR